MNDLLRRTRNTYRLGKLVTLVLLIVAAAAAGASQLDRRTPPSRPPPDPATPPTLNVLDATPVPSDTLTINLTWTEWIDLVNCVAAATTYISTSVDAGAAYIDQSTLTQAATTQARLNTLSHKLYDQAEAAVPQPPQHIIPSFYQQTEAFVDLWSTLYEGLLRSIAQQLNDRKTK